MSNDELARDLYYLFREKDYKWKIDGELRTPYMSEIMQLLDKAVDSLYDEPDGATLLMTTGRLIIKKDAGHIDVYLLIGEYDDSNRNRT